MMTLFLAALPLTFLAGWLCGIKWSEWSNHRFLRRLGVEEIVKRQAKEFAEKVMSDENRG